MTVNANMPCDRRRVLQAAEALLERDGDFLVRDSSSSAGDYVLSCYWRNEPMHFKIIRVVLRPKKVPWHFLHTSRRFFQTCKVRFVQHIFSSQTRIDTNIHPFDTFNRAKYL